MFAKRGLGQLLFEDQVGTMCTAVDKNSATFKPPRAEHDIHCW